MAPAASNKAGHNRAMVWIKATASNTEAIRSSKVTASNRATWTSKATARAAVFSFVIFSTSITGTDSAGLSLGRLAVSTIATTAALQMRIMGWVEDALNDDFSAAGIGAIVRLNNHFNSNNGAIAAGTPSTTGV